MYSDETRKRILEELENDIQRLSAQFHIPGFDRDDIQQELRLFVWTYDYNYNPRKSSIRTWGNITLKSALKNLHNAQCKTDKRKANVLRAEFDESKDHEYQDD